MNTKILMLTGKKQSGKSTTLNFLNGYMMKEAGVWKDSGVSEPFRMNEKGELLVWSKKTVDDKVIEGMGVFDLSRRDIGFINYLKQKVWPYIKGYNLADYLKDISIDLFGLSREHVYGTNEEKDSPTEIKWKDISFSLPPRTVGKLKKSNKMDEFLTGREFLQQFGTNICRNIFDDCWVNALLKDIERDVPAFAVIGDVRFPNEVKGFSEVGGKSIRFLRNSDSKDKHPSETALDRFEDFDKVIDNTDMSTDERNNAVIDTLVEWEWLK